MLFSIEVCCPRLFHTVEISRGFLLQAKAPPVIDRASDHSLPCGNRPLAYLPPASRLYEDASPKIPARLGPIGRVSATSSNRSLRANRLIRGRVGRRQKFGQNHHLTFVPNIRHREGLVPVLCTRSPE